MRKEVFMLGAVILIVSVLILGGCTQPEEAPQKPTPVKIYLKYFHQAQFAGNYVAKEKGFYANEGLNVTLVPFSPGDTPIKAVATGKADFGIAGGDVLIKARADGLKLKAIAVIYQVNPIVAYSLKESGITKPTDFAGKKVGIEDAQDIHMQYNLLMKNLGINRSNINEISIGWEGKEVLSNSVDVATGYVINEPFTAINAGQKVNTILFAKYGINSYGDTLFTTEEMINKNPELVQKVVSATLKGWAYALKEENENETIAIIMKYAENYEKHEAYMLEQSIPLIQPTETTIGEMTETGWLNTAKVLQDAGLVKEDFEVKEVYDNRFILE